jgi:hypothetical protein
MTRAVNRCLYILFFNRINPLNRNCSLWFFIWFCRVIKTTLHSLKGLVALFKSVPKHMDATIDYSVQPMYPFLHIQMDNLLVLAHNRLFCPDYLVRSHTNQIWQVWRIESHPHGKRSTDKRLYIILIEKITWYWVDIFVYLNTVLPMQ